MNLMIKKYRKKPVVIEAIKYDSTDVTPCEIIEWTEASKTPAYYKPEVDQLWISTLEGDHLISVGDYVIKGIEGEFYPCKPSIFEATYEKVASDIKGAIGDSIADDTSAVREHIEYGVKFTIDPGLDSQKHKLIGGTIEDVIKNSPNAKIVGVSDLGVINE